VRRAGRGVRTFYWKAYRDNITGLSGMVAYNLLLSLLPLALLALFVASQVLKSHAVEHSVFDDLKRLFPTTAEHTITDVLDRIRTSSAGLGIFSVVTSIWFGSSFWGSLDTAFCRIYHVRCRSWVEQKRFALGMLLVVLLLMAATVAVPTAQSILVSGTEGLPFGLAHVKGFVYAITLGVTLAILFAILCLIYWLVPNRLVPWRAIWPGALPATVAIGIVDYGFPLYLNSISTIARFGTTLIFIVIVLLWFYALAIIILGGAVINAIRFEREETGEVDLG
jgi:YihY family inner membrane protein